MKKFLGSLFIVILALVVFVVVGRDWIIKTAIEQGVTLATGFKTHVKAVKFDFPSTIQIEGLNIRNPEGFKEKNFVDIPEIYVSIVLDEVLKGKRIHLPEVRLNLQEVRIEKNEKGVSNIELLSSVGGPGAKGQGAAKPAEPSAKKPPMPFLLEKLDLTIRNVSYEDRSGLVGAAPIPINKVNVDLNLQHQTFTNISDPKVLVNIILMKILNSATLGKLLNIDPKALLGDGLSTAMNSGQALLNQSTGMVTQQLGNVTDQAKALANSTEVTRKAEALIGTSSGKATEALGDAAGAAKSQVSGLFNKIKSPLSGEKTTDKAQ